MISFGFLQLLNEGHGASISAVHGDYDGEEDEYPVENFLACGVSNLEVEKRWEHECHWDGGQGGNNFEKFRDVLVHGDGKGA